MTLIIKLNLDARGRSHLLIRDLEEKITVKGIKNIKDKLLNETAREILQERMKS